MSFLYTHARHAPLRDLRGATQVDCYRRPQASSCRSFPLTTRLTGPVRTNHQLGRSLFEQFRTVMQLTEQIRVMDAVWLSVLDNLRVGDCSRTDLETVCSLLLTEHSVQDLDFSKPPWDDITLVTPHHRVRAKWNAAALEKHALISKKACYVVAAEDVVGVDHHPLCKGNLTNCLDVVSMAY